MKVLFQFLICLIATTIGGISGVGGGVIICRVAQFWE